MYSKRERIILKYTKVKTKTLFAEQPAISHGYDHAERVAKWAVEIARAHKGNIFLSELSGIVHDIGRAIEKDNPGVRHQELSYRVLREWLKEDRVFDLLTRAEKLNILYSVRYHWNNAADKYIEAVILRDADKIDSFGEFGVKRSVAIYRADLYRLQRDFRFKYEMYYWLRTKKAKQIVAQNKYMEKVNVFYLKLIKRDIKPIEL